MFQSIMSRRAKQEVKKISVKRLLTSKLNACTIGMVHDVGAEYVCAGKAGVEQVSNWHGGYDHHAHEIELFS